MFCKLIFQRYSLIELSFRRCRCLLFGTYYPPSQSDPYYFINLDKALDMCSSYDRKVLAEDSNTEILVSLWAFFHTKMTFKTLGKKKLFSKMKIILVKLIFFDNNSTYYSYLLPQIRISFGSLKNNLFKIKIKRAVLPRL